MRKHTTLESQTDTDNSIIIDLVYRYKYKNACE